MACLRNAFFPSSPIKSDLLSSCAWVCLLAMLSDSSKTIPHAVTPGGRGRTTSSGRCFENGAGWCLVEEAVVQVDESLGCSSADVSECLPLLTPSVVRFAGQQRTSCPVVRASGAGATPPPSHPPWHHRRKRYPRSTVPLEMQTATDKWCIWRIPPTPTHQHRTQMFSTWKANQCIEPPPPPGGHPGLQERNFPERPKGSVCGRCLGSDGTAHGRACRTSPAVVVRLLIPMDEVRAV